jgi:YVTN family beta-propeller protein
MKNFKLLLVALISATVLISCSKDELDIPVYTSKGVFDSGVILLNEGFFNQSNASMSFIPFDLSRIENDVFSGTNSGLPLGDVAQSLTFSGDLAYIVVNNSNKIQIVNRYTLKKTGEIATGLSNPRYISISNNKIYVTNWGSSSVTTDDYVAVYNQSNNSLITNISVIEGPEQILESSGKLYVSHKGGYGFGNSISVINSSSNTVISNITVGDLPDNMFIDNGNLWVLCEGIYANPDDPSQETGGKLIKINLTTNVVSNTYSFPTSSHPSNLLSYNNKIYYTVGSNVFSLALTPVAPATSIALPSSPILNTNLNNIYALAVKNNKIFASEESYTSDSSVKIYSLGEIPDSPTLGTILKTYTTTGKLTNGFYFNQ